MNNNYYCVIMAGGIGTRFWPMSRSGVPKQFIDILGDGSTLIQKTFNRLKRVCPAENIFVVTNVMYKDIVKEQLPEISDAQLVLEPSRRNTAPCVAYASYKIRERNPNAVVVVAPSDHLILKEDAFVEVIEKGLDAASHNDCLLTIGITPSHPNTGYGYIQFNEEKVLPENNSIYDVKIFTEKPELEMAKSFVQSGDFLWNAGIFMWSIPSILKAFEQYLPDVNDLFRQGIGIYNTDAEASYVKQIYQVCKNISVDYAIMEHAKNVKVYAAEFGWSDLGTWGSLFELREKDQHNNTVVGKKVLTYNTSNCIVNMPRDKVVVLQGLDDYIVVENDDVLLICKKEDEQQIRQYVADVQVEFGEKYV